MKYEGKEISTIANVVMGQSPPGSTYNSEGRGLPLLNGPTEFGSIHPLPKLFTTDSKRECLEGDLIFCVRGSTTGRMNWSDQSYSLGRGVCAIRGSSISETKFIRYAIEYLLKGLLQLAGGGTFPNLNKDDILNFKIPFPDNRLEIAYIISTYDDLIENNLKRIKLLEEAVQNIYREWFVHFRFPGHETGTWYVDDMGKRLPVGWKSQPLADVIDFKEGPRLRNYQYRDSGIPFLNIRVIKDGDIDLSIAKCLDEQEVASKYSHFLLEEFDHVISTSGTLGRVATVRAEHLPLCLNTSIIRMRPKGSVIGKWLIKQIISSHEFLDEMNSLATGSAQLNFGPMHLNLMTLIVPEQSICMKFENYVTSIEHSLMNLRKQNEKLKEARDIILPRLMSQTIAI